ncbi:MAG: hypothetical protein R2736_23370 [Solirubrobacterales bacterium]
MLVEEGGVRLAGRVGRVGQDALEVGGVRREPEQDRAAQRLARSGDHGLARRAVPDDLGDHRVEGRADDLALAHPVVDANARAGRELHEAQAASGRHEAIVGVLGGRRGTRSHDLSGGRRPDRRRRLSGCDAHLLGDDVDARDLLGDRMSTRQAWVFISRK